jgi:hypothetical protein
MFRSVLAAVALATATAGCALPAVQSQVPTAPRYSYTDPSDDCASGEVIVSVDEDPGCDLVAGSNTLTITDISPQMAADYGCTFDGDDAGVNCDF